MLKKIIKRGFESSLISCVVEVPAVKLCYLFLNIYNTETCSPYSPHIRHFQQKVLGTVQTRLFVSHIIIMSVGRQIDKVYLPLTVQSTPFTCKIWAHQGEGYSSTNANESERVRPHWKCIPWAISLTIFFCSINSFFFSSLSCSRLWSVVERIFGTVSGSILSRMPASFYLRYGQQSPSFTAVYHDGSDQGLVLAWISFRSSYSCCSICYSASPLLSLLWFSSKCPPHNCVAPRNLKLCSSFRWISSCPCPTVLTIPLPLFVLMFITYALALVTSLSVRVFNIVAACHQMMSSKLSGVPLMDTEVCGAHEAILSWFFSLNCWTALWTKGGLL